MKIKRFICGHGKEICDIKEVKSMTRITTKIKFAIKIMATKTSPVSPAFKLGEKHGIKAYNEGNQMYLDGWLPFSFDEFLGILKKGGICSNSIEGAQKAIRAYKRGYKKGNSTI